VVLRGAHAERLAEVDAAHRDAKAEQQSAHETEVVVI
jgi:hypothetical protein